MSGPSNRELFYGSHSTEFLYEQIEEYRDEIADYYSKIETISGGLDELHGIMKASKGPDRQALYEKIQRWKEIRSSLYDAIQDNKRRIQMVRDEINDYRRR